MSKNLTAAKVLKGLSPQMRTATLAVWDEYNDGSSWVPLAKAGAANTMAGLVKRGIVTEARWADGPQFALTATGHAVATEAAVERMEAEVKDEAPKALRSATYGKEDAAKAKPGPRPLVKGTDIVARDFPALTGHVITQRHTNYCEAFGHASHSIGGRTTLTCPRCGHVAKTEVVWTEAERLAILDTIPLGMMLTGQEMADLIDRNGRNLFKR